jgi:hypothetical protein
MIELFNARNPAKMPNAALETDRNFNNDNRAMVQLKNNSNQPIYRVLIYDEATLPPNAMRDLKNTDGLPQGVAQKLELKDWDQHDPSFTPTMQAVEYIKVHPFDPANPSFPNGTAATNQDGYYVVASDTDIQGLNPPVQPTNRVPTVANPPTGLRYSVPMVNEGQPIPRPTHTVILQRLLCPVLPPNPVPGGAVDPNLPFNPYVTVDYVTGVQTQDGVKVLRPLIPMTPAPHTPPTPDQRASKGRIQPMAAATSVAPTPGPDSFFKPNSPGAMFDWLIHLDRPPISPMELLHVSGFKPHEVTQTFVDAGQSFQHIAAWTDDQTRLYRALEYFTVGERANWTSYVPASAPLPTAPSWGGRKPGMINVNTVWDHEILNALTDPQATNFFQQPEVDNAWKSLQGRRPQVVSNNGTDAPFMSFANPGPLQPGQQLPPGEFPTRSGFAGTFLAGDFQGAASPQSPYISQEMLRKIANTMTTRSNVFAVYLTVGFFEVMDDTVRPVRLGAEIRARNGLPIRHRMFAIVDRTNIGLVTPVTGSLPTVGLEQGGTERSVLSDPNSPQVTKTQFFVTSVDGVPTEQIGQPVTLNIVGGMANPMVYDGNTITLPVVGPLPTNPQPSFTMYADVGTQQETLQGCTINSNGQLVVPNGFQRSHAPGFSLSYLRPGNPGPQGSINYFDPRYSQVIPYRVIIQ